MMWAAGLSVNERFDQNRHLAIGDVAVDNYSSPTIKLKRSKTDQEGVGMVLYVGRTYKSACPVSAVLSYLMIRKPPHKNGPLFRDEDSSAPSQPTLVSWLKSTLQMAGVDATHFSGQSFLIRAASTTAARLHHSNYGTVVE